jgi:crotonobetainyl-CoA:carnitine CoA-transferase CaiB-like acyl-CoA transferase
MVALAVGNDKQFAKLSQLLGQSEWIDDDRLKTNSARVQNRDLIDGLLIEKLKNYSSDELIDLCRANGIPIGRVNTVKQALALEQTTAKNMVLEMEHSKAGIFRSLASPLKMHGTINTKNNAPPMLGEHTDSVLKQYLGLSNIDLNDLKNKKVIN